MKKINVDILKPGMKFSRAVYIDSHNILVGANIELTAENIERLKKWGIKQVETAGEIISEGIKEDKPVQDLKKIISEYAEFKKNKVKYKERYQTIASSMKKIFHDIREDKKLDYSKIKEIVNLLVAEVLSNKNIFVNLAHLSYEGNYLPYHSLNVCIFSLIIGNSLNYGINRLTELGQGALLHDIGMAKIPTEIIEKQEKLTDDEFNKIKIHTVYGYKIIVQDTKLSPNIGIVALQHHEACDGSGYPQKLKADQIHEYSKITSIVNVYEAITKKRAYHDETISYEAMRNVLGESSAQFDPKILRLFLSNMSIYPIGSFVKLNNNAIGIVVSANPDIPLRPVVKIIIDEFGDKEKEEKYINLGINKNFYIVGVIPPEKLGKIAIDEL